MSYIGTQPYVVYVFKLLSICDNTDGKWKVAGSKIFSRFLLDFKTHVESHVMNSSSTVVGKQLIGLCVCASASHR